MSTLPNFLIIGAQKCGTSYFAAKLAQHPQVYVCPGEVHFFDRAENYARGVEWYASLFEQGAGKRAIGEKTPDYLCPVDVSLRSVISERIHALLPDARLIVLVRNPVDRAESHINHLIRTHRISPFVSPDEVLFGRYRYLGEKYAILEKGFYFKYISDFLKYYREERILVLIFEKYVRDDVRRGLQKVCSFIGVDSDFEFKYLDHIENAYIRYGRSKWGLALQYYLPESTWIKRIAIALDHRLFKPDRFTLSIDCKNRLYELYHRENERLFSWLEEKNIWYP
ncbi:sulfotransferase family protein [Rhodothermus marinus]|uniref:sulfotransferase family protein n=1 Tax=Rhodothermus marinus TaxID=29549 RepID=UPI0012BA4B8E|nr:sulfotransferase [Rhodothermus marinus]BBM72323.1 hypothetical protein RmaAA338_11880 [Rhodothermus marinus]